VQTFSRDCMGYEGSSTETGAARESWPARCVPIGTRRKATVKTAMVLLHRTAQSRENLRYRRIQTAPARGPSWGSTHAGFE